MIFTERQITVHKGKSTINEPVILYRGDFEVSIRFTIMESKFRFKSGVNLVESEKASFGQLAILAPYGGNVFSEVVKCEDGAVTFTLTKEMIDQLEEVGLYSFQIRLFDYYRESRVSIPPVEFGIEVREPVASEDHDNTVNNAMVGYSIAKVVDPSKGNVGPTFDDRGNYNKTNWETGDRISQGKLNKIEDALDKINQNEKNDVAALDKRVTNNFNVLSNRIDNKADATKIAQIDDRITDIIVKGGSSDKDTELIDARKGEKLLRNTIDTIDNEIAAINSEFTIDCELPKFEIGSFSEGIAPFNSTTRIRSVDFLPRFDGVVTVSLTDYHRAKFYLVTCGVRVDGAVEVDSVPGWFQKDRDLDPRFAYKMLIAYADDSEIKDVNELASLLKIKKHRPTSEIDEIKSSIQNIEGYINNTLPYLLPSNMSMTTGYKKIVNPPLKFDFKGISRDIIAEEIPKDAHSPQYFTMAEPLWLEPGNSIDVYLKNGYTCVFTVDDGETITDTSNASVHFTRSYPTQRRRISISFRLGDLSFLPTDLKYTDCADIIITEKTEIPYVQIEQPVIHPTMTHGSARTDTGEQVSSTTRISTEKIFVQSAEVVFTPKDGIRCMVLKYDASGTYSSYSGWQNSNFTSRLEGAGCILVLLAHTDDQEILESDIENMQSCIVIQPISDNTQDVNAGYYFRSEKLPEILTGTNALGYNEFIEQYWEPLRAANPDYITRNNLLMDTSNTFQIYEYVFTPAKYERTVFLTAGIHGDEYEGFYSLYYIMRNITEQSYKFPQLQELRHNTRFVVVPVLNPWGLQNRKRATSRIANANNNYDVMFDATEYEKDGTHGFSENESMAVKMLADKYEGELDFYMDFHTDPYDPQSGNYILVDATAATRDLGVNLTIDDNRYLKDKYNFIAENKPAIVNINKRCSSFKYMDIVRGVPSAIVEVGTGRISKIGSSQSITMAVDWYTNCLCEWLKHNVKKNPHNKEFEKAVAEGRMEAYCSAVASNISDEGLQVWLEQDGFESSKWKNKSGRGDVTIINAPSVNDNGVVLDGSLIKLPDHSYSEYTLFFKGIVIDGGCLLSGGDNMYTTFVTSSVSERFNVLANESNPLYASINRYRKEHVICVKVERDKRTLYVDGEPFLTLNNTVVGNASVLYLGAKSDGSQPIDAELQAFLLYDRVLNEDEIGYAFKYLMK